MLMRCVPHCRRFAISAIGRSEFVQECTWRSIATQHRTASSSAALPIIDISPFLGVGSMGSKDSVAAKKRVAAELDAACREVGFFYLVGHGISEALISELHATARKFFELPSAVKEEIAVSRCPEGGRGYQRLGENVTGGRRDWHEAIDFYAEPDSDAVDFANLSRGQGTKADDSLVEAMRPFVFGRNQWPREPAEFRRISEAHFVRAATVGKALMEVMEIAFDLPEKHLQSLTDQSFWCARIIGYPPLQDARGAVGESVGVHTDYGCWTILAQDDTPGALQVQRFDGSWIQADPIPGAFVVNLGDMLSLWTGSRFAATPHRVRHTHPGRYRTSVAFFFEPNFDAVIKPLGIVGDGSPVSPDRSSHFGNFSEPLQRAMQGGHLVYGEHAFAKVSANFDFAR